MLGAVIVIPWGPEAGNQTKEVENDAIVLPGPQGGVSSGILPIKYRIRLAGCVTVVWMGASILLVSAPTAFS